VQTAWVFATYVHQLDPVIFQFTEKIALRWYGLAYLAGFVAGYFLLKRMAEKKLWVLAAERTGDFIAALAMFGVFIGGRLGYILFYQIPRDGIDSVLSDPLVIFRVWDGGMASHGGLAGVMIFAYFYARKHKVSWTGLGDGICVVAPIGLMCGRIANFINGELYGRIANGVAWAVKFPGTLVDPKAPEAQQFGGAFRAAVEADPGFAESLSEFAYADDLMSNKGFYYQRLLEANRESDKVSEAIAPYLEPRHPSQLYEAFLEGGLLFVIMWVLRVKYPKAPHGMLTGIFFGLYASFRIFAEYFREPDAEWVIDGMLTKGQFLSLFMYLFAAGFLLYAFKNRREKLR
jgi:phosphatidylglycerol---prolipoprotein diacylglyceryl transferase